MIYTRPEEEYEATFAAGESGLVGTLSLALLDNQGVVTDAFSTSDIIELEVASTPSGVYAATRTAPDTKGAYTLLWSLDGTSDPDQVFPDDLFVGFTIPADEGGGSSYSTVAELARLLKVNATTYADQLESVLVAAAGEIDSEIGLLEDDAVALAGWELSLAAQVNLERAAEHWDQRKASFGIIGLDSEGPIRLARDTWDRHAHKLAPLKQSWGLA